MILQNGHSSQYLQDYKDGKIKQGLKLGIELDKYFVHKHGQLNIILGHDNVGKSYWIEWYFLALATTHNLKFCLFMDENYHGRIMRDLIQMYAGRPYKDLTYNEIKHHEIIIENNFKFIDNTRRYTPEQLLNIFSDAKCDVNLIDPFNGLDTPMSYSSNYEVLNMIKNFTKSGQSVYINAHPSSASGRRGAVYSEKHDWSGHVMPPLKSDIEGGKPFNNKADDFLILHRLTQHETFWNKTMVEVVKVKDTDTGGLPTRLNDPVIFDYNKGLGFSCYGIDSIRRPKYANGKVIKEIEPETNLPF